MFFAFAVNFVLCYIRAVLMFLLVSPRTTISGQNSKNLQFSEGQVTATSNRSRGDDSARSAER